MSRSRDNPDPTLIVDSRRKRRQAPVLNDPNNGETEILEALVEQIDMLTRKLPSSVPIAACESHIFRSLTLPGQDGDAASTFIMTSFLYLQSSFFFFATKSPGLGLGSGPQAPGSGLENLKPEPAQAEPEPGLSGRGPGKLHQSLKKVNLDKGRHVKTKKSSNRLGLADDDKVARTQLRLAWPTTEPRNELSTDCVKYEFINVLSTDTGRKKEIWERRAGTHLASRQVRGEKDGEAPVSPNPYARSGDPGRSRIGTTRAERYAASAVGRAAQEYDDPPT
ncbi:hypothetical protein GGX14DRAFT_386722 [Mycena pura]|uniref:Uncharacterized protein n=1 Tax=Mycena pura TaxID=153505 RepID=A0AAD6YQC4_9AGAR|nr:hypothetical protein GGX14DRAFT_386722 [Mycena pura]